MAGHVYIMASQRGGTLYIGVTSDLARRVFEHKSEATKGFTSRYGCKRLVWYEEHFDIRDAIAREKSLKKWSRARKVALIETMNPDWQELYRGLW
ncbi:GIY-YIG nuclease family protein [Jiella avicenniae]|uniref:GIY-YIG nuclease family protein n=1 Tax=Jiella avicenniae TaxID=2907202 RepID=A0A9X1P4B6_9HYPH|nr:GIY-YIG nuclease family protein [Jiella avicenniae]MCE7030121.1 GIY-YIG nuclease family protein [Jiella avicenniae]